MQAHESDELRFDVVVNNLNNWCLRAETSEDRMHWVEVLQLYKEGTGSTDTTSLRRHGSTMSLQSNTISLASGGSMKKTQRNLREKVGELETFKDILFVQIETLQRYFDACSELNKSNAQPLDLGDGLKPIDFKVTSLDTLPQVCVMKSCVVAGRVHYISCHHSRRAEYITALLGNHSRER